MKVKHNSWETYYKSIKGPLFQNEECRFLITLENERNGITDAWHQMLYVEMHLYDIHNDKKEKYTMHVMDSKENPNIREYELSLAFNNTGCIYYYFLIHCKDQTYCVEHMQNNEARIIPWKEWYDPSKWQITIYQHDVLISPEINNVLISYQIFPDSFMASGMAKDNVPKNRQFYDNTKELPKLTANEDGSYKAQKFYGGDLRGIIQKIPYLVSIGINCIYLNPPYESACNHHYDSKSHYRIDPSLGTMDEFRELCRIAKQNGISIMLDMVFNHVGNESEIFKDAKDNPNSPYQDFFYYNENGRIASWWGDGDLYALNQNSQAVQRYIKDVCLFWKEKGVSLARIDVADELKNETLRNIYASIPTILEVWEDATTKRNEEGPRMYLQQGDQTDGVMNYPFRTAIIEYVKNKNSKCFYETVQYITDHYAIQHLANSLVFVSTHDTPRIMTVLGGEPLPDFEPLYRYDVLTAEKTKRNWIEEHRCLSKEQRILARKRLKIAMLIQFCLPGIPQIYYGDEVGLEGYCDPDNRRYHPWEEGDLEILQFLHRLTKCYRQHPYLKEGMTNFYACNTEYLVMSTTYQKEELILVVNVSDHVVYPKEIQDERNEIVLTTGCKQIDPLDPYTGIIVKRN